MRQQCGCDVTAMQRGTMFKIGNIPPKASVTACRGVMLCSWSNVFNPNNSFWWNNHRHKRSVVLWLAAALQRFRKSCHLTATSLCQDKFFSRMYWKLLCFYANFKFSANLVDGGWSKICRDASFCLSSICDLAIWPRCDGDLSQRLVCFLRFETCDASCDGIAAICDAMRGHAKFNCPSVRLCVCGVRSASENVVKHI